MSATIPGAFQILQDHGAGATAPMTIIKSATIQDLVRNATYTYAYANQRVLTSRAWIGGIVATTFSGYIQVLEATATLSAARPQILVDANMTNLVLYVQIYSADGVTLRDSVIATVGGTRANMIQTALDAVAGETVVIKVLIKYSAAAAAYLYNVRILEKYLISDNLPGGFVFSGTPTTYFSNDFNDTSETGALDGSSATMAGDFAGWEKADSGNMTVFGSTVDKDYTVSQDTKGWIFGYGGTGSGGTGPTGGMLGGVDATTGTINTGSGYRYMYFEGTSAYSGFGLMRTQEFDFSDSLDNETLKMTFWFHIYGASAEFGIAATTATNSASSAVEAATGTGFTAQSTGGLSIVYWTHDAGDTDNEDVRIDGQQQSGNASLWRKATVDLNALAGESSVYFYFMNYADGFRADFSIDNLVISGEE